jgi:spermidine synthase
VSTILVGLGVLLVGAAAAVGLAARGWRSLAGPAAAVAVAALAVGAAPGGCDVETTYHCVVVEADPLRPDGRVLVMDGLRHSYVDLHDPGHLEFGYVRAMAAAIDASYAEGEPLRAHHLGGGGLTLPRWLAEDRPGTRSTVSEIDPGVVEVDVEQLGLRPGDDLEVRVEDGRTGLRRLPDASRDLVVGDAFGGVSIPFHLTTVEALGGVRRVLSPDGLYLANMIDHPPLEFARAEVATLASTFGHVAVAAHPETLAGREGGNLVAVAGDRELEPDAWQQALDARETGWDVLSGARLESWVGDAEVLTDDHAPVDQLLTPYE